MGVFDGTGGGNLTAGSYGRLVERGGYATGGLVGEHGPEIAWAPAGTCVLPAAGLVSRLDTSVTVTVTGDDKIADALRWLFTQGQIQAPSDRDPDDGTAGVPAKV